MFPWLLHAKMISMPGLNSIYVSERGRWVTNHLFSPYNFWCTKWSHGSQPPNPIIIPCCISLKRKCHFDEIVVHDDVIKWEHFPRYWPFARGIHPSSVNSHHKGQWREAWMFSLICARKNGWVKQPIRRWFETPSRSSWRHCNALSLQEVVNMAMEWSTKTVESWMIVLTLV